jgi:PKD repeat protein
MKKVFLFASFFCAFFLNTKLHSQTVITCSNDSIKLRAGNHQYGILEWEKSQDAINWEKIHNQHDTTYVFKPQIASYYRSVNKLPNCAPIISSEVLVQKPPISNAGQDRLINETFVFLGSNTAIGSSGNWSVIEGTGGDFADINNPNTKFSGTTGKYILQWKLENTCGISNDTVEIEFIENQYQDKIVIVDETDTMLSTEQQITTGEYIIQFNDPVPTIDTETILIGTVDSGYLRKVNTVSQNGNTFTMTTEQGKLDDLFIDGGFELGNVFKIDSILPASKSSNYKRLNKRPTRGEILSNPDLQKGVYYYLVDEKTSSLNNNVQMKRLTSKTNNTNEEENPKFKFTLSNTLFDKNGINIKLDGSLTFTPNVFADYNKKATNPILNFGINNATVENNYKFSMTCDAQANVLDEPFNLFSYTKSVYFLVGGVPVLVDVIVDFEGKASADVSANLSFIHQFTNTLKVNAGVSYKDEIWTNYYNSSVENKLETNLDISGSFVQNFEIGPKITFKIYKVIGPYIGAKLTEELNICASSSNLENINWESDLDIGAKLTVGVRADIFKKNLFDYSETWNKKGLYNVNFPYELEVISGNNQQYSTSSPLINPVRVRVLSNKGFAIPSVTVRFEADPDTPGIIDSEYVITDSNGYAETNWTPTNNGFAKLTATVQNCEGKNIGNSPLTFEATEVQGNDCTETTLNASYSIENNIIKPTAHMGNAPYSYSTDNINFSETIPEFNLNSGQKYNFTIKDANGCTANTTYTHEETNCNDSRLEVELSTYGSNLYANGNGGTAPYKYALNDATTYYSNNVFQNLPNGIQKVKVKDANGCIESSTTNITNSTSYLLAYFETSNNNYFNNSPVRFNNLSNNAVSYSWDFGDGNTSTLVNPVHFYQTAGNYTVQLTVQNSSYETNVFTSSFEVQSANNENTYVGSISLTTQQEVDKFGNNYNSITGDLDIDGISITNLNALRNLTSVGGYLYIRDNYNLSSLTGLENITSVGGDLSISYNDSLSSLTGLENITSVGGYLYIISCSNLSSLTALENITSVGGNLDIYNNDNLSSLTGLENITSVGGYLSIIGNDNLNSLTGLENITSVGGNLQIGRSSSNRAYPNPNLTNLCAIKQLITNGQIGSGEYFVENNGYNPSYEEIQNAGSGGCRE